MNALKLLQFKTQIKATGTIVKGQGIATFEYANEYDAKVICNHTSGSSVVVVPNFFGFEYTFDLTQWKTCTLTGDVLDFLEYMNNQLN